MYVILFDVKELVDELDGKLYLRRPIVAVEEASLLVSRTRLLMGIADNFDRSFISIDYVTTKVLIIGGLVK